MTIEGWPGRVWKSSSGRHRSLADGLTHLKRKFPWARPAFAVAIGHIDDFDLERAVPAGHPIEIGRDEFHGANAVKPEGIDHRRIGNDRLQFLCR